MDIKEATTYENSMYLLTKLAEVQYLLARNERQRIERFTLRGWPL